MTIEYYTDKAGRNYPTLTACPFCDYDFTTEGGNSGRKRRAHLSSCEHRFDNFRGPGRVPADD